MSAGLKFAVNAGPLRHPITGIGRYLRELMREVERDGRFAPEYFCALRWSRGLDQLPAGAGNADSGGMNAAIRLLRPALRRVARMSFAAGVRRGNFAFYFEPAYLPYATPLPTIITIHDLSHLRHPETHPVNRVRELDRDLPAAVARADRILTVSDFTRREVLEVFGVDPSRVVTTPLGVEPRFFPRTAAQTSPLLAPLALKHGQYFLAVGTLEPRKNVLTVVEAHSRLPAPIREAYPLAVAGMKGWLTHAITRRLEVAQSRGDVRLLGYVDDRQLPLLYSGAALVSYPSIYEGFGLPLLEAMASGVPVAASNRASMPEVVGDAGILLDPEDVEGFTSVMRRIVDDAEFANDLSARALERAKLFTWKRCAVLTMQSWESVLGTV